MTLQSSIIAAIAMTMLAISQWLVWRYRMLNMFLHQKSAGRNQIAPIGGMSARNNEVCFAEPLAQSAAITHFTMLAFGSIILNARRIMAAVKIYGNSNRFASLLKFSL